MKIVHFAFKKFQWRRQGKSLEMHRTYYKALLATTLTVVFQICSGFGAWRNNNSPVRIVSTQKLHATRREFCAAIACTTVGVFGTSLNIEEAGAVNDDFFRSGGYGKGLYGLSRIVFVSRC